MTRSFYLTIYCNVSSASSNLRNTHYTCIVPRFKCCLHKNTVCISENKTMGNNKIRYMHCTLSLVGGKKNGLKSDAGVFLLQGPCGLWRAWTQTHCAHLNAHCGHTALNLYCNNNKKTIQHSSFRTPTTICLFSPGSDTRRKMQMWKCVRIWTVGLLSEFFHCVQCFQVCSNI